MTHPYRWAFALLCLTALMTPLHAEASKLAAKPNLLLIYVDDLGYGDPGCYGGQTIPTPNIDSLAKAGVRFTDGYVTTPVCGPSRLGLLTGAYPQRFGGYWNDDLWAQFGLTIPAAHKLLPQALKTAGYVTGHVGKWNITSDPKPYVDEAHDVMLWKGAYFPDEKGDYLGVNGPDFRNEADGWGPAGSEDEYLTDRLARRAVQFIEQHRARPFFLYLAFNAPHSPLHGQTKYQEQFRHLSSEPLRLYAAMVASLDENIGRVLSKLRAVGLEENTLVAFVSDNGPAFRNKVMLGSAGPLNGHKGQLYEGGIRVPYLLRWPAKLKPGQTFHLPVSTLDLYPTFCGAVGAPLPADTVLDGVDLLPFLCGEQSGVPHRILFWKTHRGGAVRSGDWKLLMQPDGSRQLFHLGKDLGEKTNLAAENPDPGKRLYEAWKLWSQPLPPRARDVAERARRARKQGAPEAQASKLGSRKTTEKGGALGTPPPAPEGYEWQLNPKFSDEFNGTSLDESKWFDHHPRWKGRPPAKFMPSAVSVKDGMLQIKNSVLDPAQGPFKIAGGAVVSKSSDAHFGYYAVRMKASKISMSSTFWFSNKATRRGNRSISQELDVQEAVGAGKRQPGRKHYMKSNTHVWVRENGKRITKSVPGEARISPPAGEAFHIYGVWWVDANTVHFYHNDKFKFTLRPNTQYHPTPFERPMHMNLVTETYNWETPPTPAELKDDSINTTYYDWARAYVLVKKK